MHAGKTHFLLYCTHYDDLKVAKLHEMAQESRSADDQKWNGWPGLVHCYTVSQKPGNGVEEGVFIVNKPNYSNCLFCLRFSCHVRQCRLYA